MGHPLTIMIDEEIERKLRVRQAKLLRTSDKSISFSKVLNDCLKEFLKKDKI